MANKETRDKLYEKIRKLENELSSCLLSLRKQIPRSYYKGIVDNASDAIYIHDLEGHFVEVNDMACKMLGYSRQELLALSVFDVDAMVAPREVKAFWKTLGPDDVFSFKGKSQHKDGICFPVDVRIKPLDIEGKRHITAIVRDITEDRRQEEALLLSEARYRAVVEAQTEFICRWKPDGTITFVNEAYCRYFGRKENELIGEKFVPFIYEDDRQKVAKHFSKLTPQNPVASHEHRAIDLNGKVRWQRWTNRAVFDDRGKLIEIQDVGRDITEEKENAAIIREMQIKLIEADKMSALGQLVAGVAHEINNSTNFMSGALPSLSRSFNELKEMLDRKNRGTEIDHENELSPSEIFHDIEHLLENINEGSQRAKKIVNDLRFFSDHRKDELLLTDLHPMIDSTLSLLYYQYNDRIEIKKEYGAKQSMLYCYPNQLAQLFMNILLNGFQAIEGDGLLTITTGNEGNTVFVTIHDSGRGISAEIEKKIFEPFFTTKEIGEGTGLGLSISYGIVKNINGEIAVSSTPGVGTEFKIVLPLDVRRK